jgi:hypothetical protein
MSGLPVYGEQGKLTWRMLATVLGGQGIVIIFGALLARGYAVAEGSGAEQRVLYGGLGLAVAAFVVAGLMRTPIGITLGWLIQVATWASALVAPAMIGVGLIFTGLWILCIVQGRKADAFVAAREAQATAR